jgi:hypothetical protein
MYFYHTKIKKKTNIPQQFFNNQWTSGKDQNTILSKAFFFSFKDKKVILI